MKKLNNKQVNEMFKELMLSWKKCPKSNSEFQREDMDLKKRFIGIGWKSKILFKRVTAYFSINKLVVDGCNLEKGDDLYSYLAEDEQGRKIIITYLDGKKANKFKDK